MNLILIAVISLGAIALVLAAILYVGAIAPNEITAIRIKFIMFLVIYWFYSK